MMDRAFEELRAKRDGAASPVEEAPESGEAAGATAPPPGAAGAVAAVGGADPTALLRAYNNISAMLQSLRSSRGTLAQVRVEKLQHTNAKLHEVSSATEVAATGLLDVLDRALGMVDELDALDETGNGRAVEIRGRLRDELFQAISGLQFQDITSQQLNYASSVLVDMEERLAEVEKAFDPGAIDALQPSAASFRPTRTTPAAGVTFDPNASVNGADERQALADLIFDRID